MEEEGALEEGALEESSSLEEGRLEEEELFSELLVAELSLIEEESLGLREELETPPQATKQQLRHRTAKERILKFIESPPWNHKDFICVIKVSRTIKKRFMGRIV